MDQTSKPAIPCCPGSLVAIVGAGPAGIFAARELVAHGAQAILFNRDIKPGGLAEYGIYPDKTRLKTGLRAQFQQVLRQPGITYYGNLRIGQTGDLTLPDLQQMGFQAILIAAGAQGTKWLGIPGENLAGVYHAKDVVYHYNQLPPYSQRAYPIGRRVAVIGVGNVMADITRYLIEVCQVDEVIAVARRSPAEVKFDKKELEALVFNFDLPALQAEVARTLLHMQAMGTSADIFWDLINHARQKACPACSPTRLVFRFLSSPVRIHGDTRGHVCALEVENNQLVLKNGGVRSQGLGKFTTLDVDTIIFAIGDEVDEKLGLPVANGEFVKHPQPNYPVEGQSYEVFNPQTRQALIGIFVAGWSRKASAGLVGAAHRDGVNAARAILRYLSRLPPAASTPNDIADRLQRLGKPIVTLAVLERLDGAEQQRAAAAGLLEFKFNSNQEMLVAAGLLPESSFSSAPGLD